MFYKKRLGQNFLIDKNIVRKIIDSCELKKRDSVLEIGAGRGELTLDIAERVKRLITVEVDKNLCEILKMKLKNFRNVEVVCKDILKYEFKEGRWKVIGNLPYKISTPILTYLINNRFKITQIFISLQKELAQRLTASPGNKDYGAFTLFTQYYTEPKILFSIKKTCFFPSPEVDSAFLRLNLRKELEFSPKNESLLFKIVKKVFSQRRKMLKNSLEDLFQKDMIKRTFEELRLALNVRPEELSLADFCRITDLLSKPNFV